MKKIVFIGGKGLSLQIASWMSLEKKDFKILGVYDDESVSKSSFKIKGKIKDLKVSKNIRYYLTLGDPFLRKRIYLYLKKKHKNLIFSNFIFKNSLISEKKLFADKEGLIIGPNCLAEKFTNVGRCCILNAHSSLFHEVQIGDFCTLAPYSSAMGGSSLGDCVLLGAHSSVNPQKKISNNIILGSHGNAVHDLKKSGVYVGNPAKRIKDLF